MDISDNKVHFTQKLNTTRKLLDPETKILSFVWTEPRTQQAENEDPRAVFSISVLARPMQPSHLRTQMMS